MAISASIPSVTGDDPHAASARSGSDLRFRELRIAILVVFKLYVLAQ
jgi:hypothetical protein